MVRSTQPGYSNFLHSISVADTSLMSVTAPRDGVNE